MAEIIDEFVLNYTLQRLQEQLTQNKTKADAYYESNDATLTLIDNRVSSLEDNALESIGGIDSLTSLLDGITQTLNETIRELNKTKLINLKQEIVVRTLHNLKMFEANDMYADTFSDTLAIDWDSSIRAEWLTEYSSMGRSRHSSIVVEQSVAPSYMLISQNGMSDSAVTQLFQVDKTREVDKISVFIEPFNNDTYQPVVISLREAKDGAELTTAVLQPEDTLNGWIDLAIPAYLLTGDKDYYIDIRTNDIYGYKVGMDTIDRYLPGTSFSLFNSVWTDNNYDIAFKVWCFPTPEENDSIIYTMPKTFSTTPETMIFEREETIVNGTIEYFISRDNGVHWKTLQPGMETDLNDQPVGNIVVLKAVITGDSRIDAWGYVIKRGDA